MKKRKRMLCVTLALIMGLPNLGMHSMAAGSAGAQTVVAEGKAGETINGEYVMVINTNPDPSAVQSTGILNFDALGGGDASGRVASEPAPLNADSLPAGMYKSYDVNSLSEGITAKSAGAVSSNMLPEESISSNMLPAKSRGLAKTLDKYAIGDTRSFSGGVDAELIGIGTHCYVWMERGLKGDYDAAGKTDTAAREMITIYDKGPYEALKAISGDRIPDADGSGKLSIVMHIIPDSTGYYGKESGITAVHVQTPQAGSYSLGDLNKYNGLLVHEGQHAVFDMLAADVSSDRRGNRWINEALSVGAMDWYWGGGDPSGWLDTINGSYQLRNGSPLVYASYRGNTLQDYSLPYLFFRYLADQKGGGYNPVEMFRCFYGVSDSGKLTAEEYMDAVLSAAGLKDEKGAALTFRKAVQNFYLAAVIQDAAGVYGFYQDPVIAKKITDYPVYMGNSGEAVRLGGMAALLIKTSGGAFSVPADGGADIRYYAFDKGGAAVELEGAGTAGNPYKITNLAQLNALSLEAYAGKHFRLQNDITITAGESYFSTVSFSGNLDGGGFGIHGLRVPLVKENKGVIRNLKVTAAFRGEYSGTVGVVANINSGRIEECRVSGTVDADFTGGNEVFYSIFGGIAGENSVGGSIKECSVDASIALTASPAHTHAGALTGNNRARITNSYTAGSLTVTQNGKAPAGKTLRVYAGGIAGDISSTWGGVSAARVENVYSVTDVSVSASDTGGLTIGCGRFAGNIPAAGSYGAVAADQMISCYTLEGIPAVGLGGKSLVAVKTMEALKRKETYSGWDFAAVWNLPSGGYPVLGIFGSLPGTLTVESVAGTERQNYYIGEAFEGYMLNLLVKNTGDGSSATVPVTLDMLSDFSTETPGKHTVNGSYRGVAFTFPVTVNEPANVTKLEVYKYPMQEYMEGDTFDASGTVLKATVNGAVRYIYSGYTWNKTFLKQTDTEVEFTYGEAKVTVPLAVRGFIATELILVKAPSRTTYTLGAALDLSDLQLRLRYRNGTLSTIIRENTLKLNKINLAITQGSGFVKLDEKAALTEAENGKSIYAYYGDILPGVGNPINHKLMTLTVQDKVTLADQTIRFAVNKDGAKETEEIAGGSGNYDIALVSGTLPAGITYEKPSMANSWKFRYWGTATAIGDYPFVYRITDKKSGEEITVNILLRVTAPTSTKDILSYAFTKEDNPHLPEGVIGEISGDKIRVLMKEGTDVSGLLASITTSSDVVDGMGPIMPFISSTLDFTKNNPMAYTVTAEDGSTKGYEVLIAFYKEEKLGTPSGLSFEKRIAKWNSVVGAASYRLTLYKNGVLANTYTTTGLVCDLTGQITENGNYSFKVQALGDGMRYQDGDITAMSPVCAYVPGGAKLPAPDKLTFTKGEAAWSAVENASGYAVHLIKDGTTMGNPYNIADLSFDFTAYITEAGTYTFRVRAIGDGVDYANSDISAESNAYVHIQKAEQLAKPTDLTWNGTVAKWQQVKAAESYSLQLCKDGAVIYSTSTKALETELKDYITTAGDYLFRVTAVNADATVKSEAAESPVYHKAANEDSPKPGEGDNTGDSGDTGNGGNAGEGGNSGNTGNGGNAGEGGNSGNTGNSGNAGNAGNSGNADNSGIVSNSGNAGNNGNAGDANGQADAQTLAEDRLSGDKDAEKVLRLIENLPYGAGTKEKSEPTKEERKRIAECKAAFDLLDSESKNKIAEEYLDLLERNILSCPNIKQEITEPIEGLTENIKYLSLLITPEELLGEEEIILSLTIQDKTENEEIAQMAAENGMEVGYLMNITIHKEKGGKKEEISEMDNPVLISMTIPEKAKGKEEYKILRIHGNRIDWLDAISDGFSISFGSDKFSVYAIAYKEAAGETGRLNRRKSGEENIADSGQTAARNAKAVPFTAVISIIAAAVLLAVILLVCRNRNCNRNKKK